MSNELESKQKDPDMQAVRQALARAARRAREVARATGTPLVFFEDGVVVEEYVTDSDEAPHT